jgi:hypothetical protein
VKTSINTPTYPHLVRPPAAVPPHGPDFTTQASQPSPHQAPAGFSAPPTPGQSSGYPERVIEMLCASIRQYGLSEAAAAAKVGMSPTTLYGWKREFPEIGHRLAQAREACRTYYLDIVQRHAEAEDGRGLRAAAWLLERLFPGDYAPRMRERFAYQGFEAGQLEREDRAILEETLAAQRQARRKQAAAADQARKAREEAEAAEAAAAEKQAAASVGDLHNVKNSGEAEPSDEGKRAGESTFLPESDLQNGRKGGDATSAGEPESWENHVHRL